MMTRLSLTSFRWLFLLLLLLSSGCAYKLGHGARTLPGGYRQMSIPMFKNRSQETGIEVAFTDAVQAEFIRSKVARVVEDPLAEVRLEGEIVSVSYSPEAKVESGAQGAYLPTGTVIASQYHIAAVVEVRLIRRSDGERLWQGRFDGQQTYSAPQVTLSGVNSVDPLYNLSARRQNIQLMANDMMVEAHNRITENF